MKPKMVQVHKLRASLTLALLRDLQSYKTRCKEDCRLNAGDQLPRTDFGWLISHFKNTAVRRRNNGIETAIKQYNRSRGNPIDDKVFKDANQYAKCLVQVEINQDGEVVYKGAADRIWNSKLGKYVIHACYKNIDNF